jgi:hypothetical protein
MCNACVKGKINNIKKKLAKKNYIYNLRKRGKPIIEEKMEITPRGTVTSTV